MQQPMNASFAPASRIYIDQNVGAGLLAKALGQSTFLPLIHRLREQARSHILSVPTQVQRYFMLVNANFTPMAISTAPMVRSNQCPIRANPARTRCWLNSMATRQNHNAVATARYTP